MAYPGHCYKWNKNSATVFMLLAVTTKNRGEIVIRTMESFVFVFIIVFRMFLEVKLNANAFPLKCKFEKKFL